MLRYYLFFILLLTSSLSVLAQEDSGGSAESYDERKERLIALVAETEDFSDWLSNYEGWQGKAWPKEEDDEDGLWYVEFKDENDEEWLGRIVLDLETVDARTSVVLWSGTMVSSAPKKK